MADKKLSYCRSAAVFRSVIIYHLVVAASCSPSMEHPGAFNSFGHEHCRLGTDFENLAKMLPLWRARACGEKKNRTQPFVQRYMARLEQSSNLDRERFATAVALVGADPGARATKLANSVECSTAWAHRSFRPNPMLSVAVGF